MCSGLNSVLRDKQQHNIIRVIPPILELNSLTSYPLGLLFSSSFIICYKFFSIFIS